MSEPKNDERVNLRSIEMNLLVMSDTRTTERHVTPAAVRNAMSQLAISNALSPLRALFKEELLVHTAQEMESAERAIELREPASRRSRNTRGDP